MRERQSGESREETEKRARGPNIPDEWKLHILRQALKEFHKPSRMIYLGNNQARIVSGPSAGWLVTLC